jgi:rSAM/selenodomain-associated transferase 1
MPARESSVERQFNRTTLGVFAKHWAPGSVKTRLAASIGSGAASELYRAFLHRTLDQFASAAETCVLAYSPPEQRDAFAFVEHAGWRLRPQSTGDLGHRMRTFFEQAFSAGAERVVLIGSDSPTLPLDYVRHALDVLTQADVVLGPAADGGYYLVGAARQVPPIFEQLPWSTPQLCRQTIARLDQTQTTYTLLPEWYDVDDVKDLARLEQELSVLSSANAAWQTLWMQVKRALV